MLNNKIFRWIVSLSIFFITLLEMYIASKISREYEGIYQMSTFNSLFMLQALLFHLYVIKKVSKFKRKIVFLSIFSIALPVVIYYTLPSYTYSDGHQIVVRHVGNYESVEFVELKEHEKTIPLINNDKHWLLSDRAYYYVVTRAGEKAYYIVLPLTGKLVQLTEGYW